MDAPVEDLGYASRSQPPVAVAGKPFSYTVVKGDTLFSIALRYDLDYKSLALANNISPPYIIRPNDIIYLQKTVTAPATANAGKNNTHSLPHSAVQQSTKNTGVIAPKGVQQSQKLPVVNKDKPVVNKLPAKPQVTERDDFSISVNSAWIWPVAGKVVRQFSPQDALSKGIDISAEMGVPVMASRSGEVVYAGGGLKGYGNLIIIRHDDVYISAYAHNRTMLVGEGQTVKQGDKIAELGMSGTQIPKLHFEIREHGKPINPLQLLPAK